MTPLASKNKPFRPIKISKFSYQTDFANFNLTSSANHKRRSGTLESSAFTYLVNNSFLFHFKFLTRTQSRVLADSVELGQCGNSGAVALGNR